MTLPVSGNSIKLSQVNTELSNSSTATINIGNSSVRELFGVASGAISLSNGYGKSSVVGTFWLNSIDVAGSNEYIQSVSVVGDSVFVSGYTQLSGAQDAILLRFNKDGTLQWQLKYASTTGDDTFNAVATDSSGNVYVAGTWTYADYQSGLVIYKFDSAGTSLASPINYRATYLVSPADIAIDSSGNIFIVCASDLSSSGYMSVGVYKLNGSTLNPVWVRTLYIAMFLDDSTGVAGTGLSIDPSGNIFVIARGHWITDNWGNGAIVVKMNTSGSVLWQKYLTSSNTATGTKSCTDSSGNVYVAGYYTESSTLAFLAKFDTNGNLLWQRSVANPAWSAYGTDCCLDPSGNVYLSGYTNVTGGSAAFLVKYDSAGTALWQRSFTQSGVYLSATGITADSEGVFVTGAAGSVGFTIKVPSGGAKTGTYNGITWGPSSFTLATGTMVLGTASLNIKTPFSNQSSATLTRSTFNATVTKTSI